MFGVYDYTKPIIDYSNFDMSQLGDVLLFGGSVVLIGMATVFAVLCLLWLFLVIFRIVFHDIPEKNSSKKKAYQPVEIKQESSQVQRASNDDEIIAVIAAAIAMAESEGSDTKFRVVSFRRV